MCMCVCVCVCMCVCTYVCVCFVRCMCARPRAWAEQQMNRALQPQHYLLLDCHYRDMLMDIKLHASFPELAHNFVLSQLHLMALNQLYNILYFRRYKMNRTAMHTRWIAPTTQAALLLTHPFPPLLQQPASRSTNKTRVLVPPPSCAPASMSLLSSSTSAPMLSGNTAQVPAIPHHQTRRRRRETKTAATPSGILEQEPGVKDPQGAAEESPLELVAEGFDDSSALEEAIRRDANVQVRKCTRGVVFSKSEQSFVQN